MYYYKTFVLFFLMMSLVAQATPPKERRVYYLDCSYSMVKPNKIWKDVCGNLKKAIDNVQDEQTELVVIPFAVDGVHHSVLSAQMELATNAGKDKLKSFIDGIVPSTKSMTYHSDPLADFYNNSRVASDRITYMFLMTDGQNEENPDRFLPLLKQWKGRLGNKDVYGFYVMLNQSARNSQVEDIISAVEDHLWSVATADVNINLIRLDTKVFFNSRENIDYVDVPMSGDASHSKFLVKGGSKNYSVTGCKVVDGALRIFVSKPSNLSVVPDDEDCFVSVEYNGGQFDFLVTNQIVIHCENKKVKSVNPTFK